MGEHQHCLPLAIEVRITVYAPSAVVPRSRSSVQKSETNVVGFAQVCR
jgi:hypothetical protein